MSDEVNESPREEAPENFLKVGVIAVIAVLVLTGITVGAYQYAKKRSSATVLPGGTTYLGPGNAEPTKPPAVLSAFTADAGVTWSTFTGKNHPFSFSYPATLPTVVFPNDVTDSVAISWNNVPPQNNIFFRVINIPQTEPKMTEFIGQPMEYAKNWWKQWGGLKGVKSVEEFTNAKSMVGYRVKFINTADQTPNEDVFFPVPTDKNLMVRFANGPIDKEIFDRITDSFAWGTATAKEATPSVAQKPTTP
jgi:hypothetical protein